ncbi:MAG TPA: hypothetical protein VE549_14865, partial [Myxococcaceae bacterium]|nr:hypothetical protein [Myxococcaceae bacterium]
IDNRAGVFASPPTLDPNAVPNQQFRADLVSASAIAADPFTVAPADVLLNMYQTQPGDPNVSGYRQVSVDTSAFTGRDVCIRFAEVDSLFYFHAGIDAVSIDLRTSSAN